MILSLSSVIRLNNSKRFIRHTARYFLQLLCDSQRLPKINGYSEYFDNTIINKLFL